jgi:phage FluMu protein Com
MYIEHCDIAIKYLHSLLLFQYIKFGFNAFCPRVKMVSETRVAVLIESTTFLKEACVFQVLYMYMK